MPRIRFAALALFLSLGALPAQAQWESTEAGASLTERQGNWGYRVQLAHRFSADGNGASLGGEWAWDAAVGAAALTGRYRFGGDHWGIWPLLGWRGQLTDTQGFANGLHGPEVGLGAEVGFGPGTAWLRAEGGPVIGLDGRVGGALRVASRYRVLRPLELEASYRLENWASATGWSHVWGLGAFVVF